MNVQKLDLNSPLAQRIYDLKLGVSLSAKNGYFKQARIARKELADIASKNFELVMNVPNPKTGNFAF